MTILQSPFFRHPERQPLGPNWQIDPYLCTLPPRWEFLKNGKEIFDITTIYTSRYLYQIFYNNNKKSYNCFGLVTLLNSELNVFLTLFCILLFVLPWLTTKNVIAIVRLSSTNRGAMTLMSSISYIFRIIICRTRVSSEVVGRYLHICCIYFVSITFVVTLRMSILGTDPKHTDELFWWERKHF